MSALHDLTIKAIRRAQSQGGIVDPVEDYSAITELDRLARASTEMVPEDRLLFLDLPVVVGNVMLYRLSWGASDWLTQCAMEWFRDEPTMLDRSIVWAHVHSHEPKAFDVVANSISASKAIMEWSQGLTASFQSLMAAADQLCPNFVESDEPEKKKSGPISNGPVLNRLMEDYKQKVEYFIWEISAEALAVLIRANRLQAEMNDREQISAAGVAPSVDSRITKSIMKFQRAAKDFVSTIVARSKGSK
jgi:hypothetical protein